MGEIVNLRRAKKGNARAEESKTAEANRVAHGTPKAMRKLNSAQEEKTARAHDGKRLAPEEDS